MAVVLFLCSTICGLDWSFANTSLVAAYANTIAKVWTVQNVISSKKSELRHSVFDAAWIPSSPDEEEDEFTLTAALDYDNKINVSSVFWCEATEECPAERRNGDNGEVISDCRFFITKGPNR